MDLNFELAPKPGTTLGQRKAELDGTRFVAVRNLAHIHYKNPDGTQLMSYTDTLGDREVVKRRILEYEIRNGLIADDGSGLAPAPSQPQQAPAAPANGVQNGHNVQQQQMPFSPAPGMVPQGQPMQQQMMQPAPQMVPQQQMMVPGVPPTQQPMQQQMMQPGPAMSSQIGAPVGVPGPETAPASGQKPSRRKAAGAAGAAVAPPPAAPPPGPAQGPAPGAVVAQQPMMQQPMVQQPMMAQPGPAAFQPQAFSPAPQTAPVQPQVPPQVIPQAAATDLGPLLQRIDQLGKGVEVAANNGDQALKMVEALSGEMRAVRNDLTRLLTAVHHFYMFHNDPKLKAAIEGKNTLTDFRQFLNPYAGLPNDTP